MKIIFYLYAPSLRDKKDKIILEISKQKETPQLKQRNDIHEDIFQAVFTPPSSYTYIEYYYVIDKSISCKSIQRYFGNFSKGKENSEIFFFDTPSEFIEKNTVSSDKYYFQQTDKFSLMNFIQIQTNINMIVGLQTFIQGNLFSNKDELLSLIFTTIASQMIDLVHRKQFNSILERFNLFKSQFLLLKLEEISYIFNEALLKSDNQETNKQIQDEINSIKKSFTILQLFRETKRTSFFSKEELIQYAMEYVMTATEYQIMSINSSIQEQFSQLSYENQINFEEVIRVYWNRCWFFVSNQTSLQQFLFLIRFSNEMKPLINSKDIEHLFTSYSNQYYQKEEFLNSLISNFSCFIKSFDKNGEITNKYVWKCMNPNQQKQILNKMNQLGIKPQIKADQFWKEISSTFSNFDEMKLHFEFLRNNKFEFNPSSCLISGFEALVQKIPKKEMMEGILSLQSQIISLAKEKIPQIVYTQKYEQIQNQNINQQNIDTDTKKQQEKSDSSPILDPSKEIKGNSDEPLKEEISDSSNIKGENDVKLKKLEEEEKKEDANIENILIEIENKVKESIINAFTMMNMDELVVSIFKSNDSNLYDKYKQILKKTIKNKVIKAIDQEREIEIYEHINQQIIKLNKSQAQKKQCYEMILQKFEKKMLEKYKQIRKSGNQLSSPYTLKIVQRLPSCITLIDAIKQDVFSLAQNINSLDIFLITKMIISSPEVGKVFNFFQHSLGMNFQKFSQGIQNTINIYQQQRQMLLLFFQRFEEYLPQQNAFFKQNCLENVNYGYIMSILGQFNDLQLIYNFYFQFQTNQIFNKILHFYESQIKEKNLNSLNFLLLETKQALNQFVNLFTSLSLPKDQVPSDFLPQFNITYEQTENLALLTSIYSQGAITFSNLTQLSGTHQEDMKENIIPLLESINKMLIEPALLLIQFIAKIQFIIKASKSILELIQIFSLDQNNKANTEFMNQTQFLTNPDNNVEGLKIIESYYYFQNFYIFDAGYVSDLNIQYIPKLNEILDYYRNNLQGNSFLDMRDLIDGDDTESMALLIKLDSLNPLLKDLLLLQDECKKQQILIFQFVERILQIIRIHLKNVETVENINECSENFYKISQVQQSYAKKKSYITVVKEIVQNGEFTFSSTSSTEESVLLTIQCSQKKYTEEEIHQICSRVILEQGTNTSIAIKAEMKQALNQSMIYHKKPNRIQTDINIKVDCEEYDDDDDDDQKNQLEKQALEQLNRTINQFKEQWFEVEQLKQGIHELLSFGEQSVLKDEKKFSNANNKYQESFEKMKKESLSLKKKLTLWKEELGKIFQLYPAFTLVGFKHYQLLQQIIEGKINNSSKISYDANQILSFLNAEKTKIISQVNQCRARGQETDLQYLAKIICKKFQFPEGDQDFKDKRVISMSFSNNKSLLNFLISKVSKSNCPPQYYQFFFYDSNSQIQDFELFLFRYQYFRNCLNFFIVFNSKINSLFYQMAQELLSKLTNLDNISNKLYILIQEINDIKYFPEIQQAYQFGEAQFNQNSLYFQECSQYVQFFSSRYPGEGKTFQIQQKSLQKKKGNQIRVPTSSSEDKKSFLENLQKNYYKCNDVESIHIDLYITDIYDLNLLLFEIILLRSVSIHNSHLFALNPNINLYIEVSNTLQNTLLSNLHIIKYFQSSEVQFNMNLFEICKLNNNLKQSLNQWACYKYLEALSQCQFIESKGISSLKVFYLDQKGLPLQEQDNNFSFSEPFKVLLNKYIIQDIINRGEQPCFYQLQRFIDLFGSEMRKFENSIFLSHDYLEADTLKNGLRSYITAMSFILCKQISLSHLSYRQIQMDPQKAKEDILDSISKSIQSFNNCKVNFVTFQEQEYSSVTTFFDNEKSVPQAFKTLYEIQKSELLYFDSPNSPEILLNWLILLINQNEQNLYNEQKNKSFDQIKNEKLRELVQRVSIQKDNFFKIASIFLKIRANIPIIIMGEAGIGKTVLIELMSCIMEAHFFIMIVHTGVTDSQVVEFVNRGIQKLQETNKTIVLFFDEVNTSNMVGGLFKEILVDKCLKGIPLPLQVIPIAAINPYKLKSEKQKEMLNIQIHGGIKKEMIKKIKSSNLEYMVQPLPESMYSLIWNFDSLSKKDERIYIDQMISIKCKLESQRKSDTSQIFDRQSLLIANAIFESQQFIRQEMGYVSSCSLRDVARFIKVLYWMADFLKMYNSESAKYKLDLSIACPCLAFYIIYCVRLPLNHQRQMYMRKCSLMMEQRTGEYQQIIENIQQFFINQCDVPPGIVKNSALKQNIFTLFVSIANKIPVVLIGPPGSSKTQSIRILIQSMKGSNSRTPFLQKFQALIPLFYQGHVQSTSERILEVFQKANEKQDRLEKDKQTDQYISLVYIEELGLAEISPHNPLKVLHYTLENPRVAVACISNWPLDQSKMNRMTSIFRMDTTQEELEEIFHHIWNEFKNSQDSDIKKSLENSIQSHLPQQIAKAYLLYLIELKKKYPQFENFHGMRDYYGMVKLLCYEEIKLIKNKIKPSQELKILSQQDRVVQAFLRHFSGLGLDVTTLLKNCLKSSHLLSDSNHNFEDSKSHIINHLKEKQNPQFIPRHLMIIAENVQQTIEFVKQNLHKNQKEVKTIIGGDFSDEVNADRVFDAINEIINCVEQGICLILTNLDAVYQSLYELLNQSYRYFNGKNYCKISFGSDSNNIQVSNNFKLILIVQKDQISRMDGPLLNRFEKHMLTQSMMIDENSQNCINYVNKSMEDFKNLFSFSNMEEIIYSLVIAYKDICNSQQIIQDIYHLGDLKKMIGKEEDLNARFKSQYFKSGLHYNLDSFLTNYISLKNKDTKGYALATIFTYSSFMKNQTLRSPEIIYLSQTSSSQQLQSEIKNFFQYQQNSYFSPDSPPILAIIADMEQSDFKLTFIQQKIEEIIPQSQKQQFKGLILTIVTIKDDFKMIPYSGQWQQFFIEDLKPLSFIQNDKIKAQFNLETWFNDLSAPLSRFINFDQIIENFQKGQDNIAISYSRIQYQKCAVSYQLNRLSQLQELLCTLPDGNQKLSGIREFFLAILKSRCEYTLENLKIFTLNQFIQEYVIRRGFINQSSSLATAIWKAVNDIIADSFSFLIHALESHNLLYAFHQSSSRTPQYIQYLLSKSDEVFQFSKNQDKFFENQQSALKGESKDILIENSIRAFEKLEGIVKTNNMRLMLVDEIISIEQSWISFFSEEDLKIFQLFEIEISLDFEKYNPLNLNPIDIQIIELLFPQRRDFSLSFIRYLIVFSTMNKQIRLISALIKEFEWIETAEQLCNGFELQVSQNHPIKQFGIFLINKLYLLIEPSQRQMKCQVNIISKIHFLLQFIQSSETYNEMEILNSQQQLTVYYHFLRLFIQENQANNQLFNLIDLQKINEFDLAYLHKLKESIFYQIKNQKRVQENWIEFNIELLLSAIHSRPDSKFNWLCKRIVNYLIQIEQEQLQMFKEIPDKFVIQVNLVLSTLVSRLTDEGELIEIYWQERTENQMIDQINTTSQFATLVIFQSILQSTFVKNHLEEKQKQSMLPSILVKEQNLLHFTPLQQVIYFAIFRQVTKIALDSIQENSQPLMYEMKTFFSKLQQKFLQTYIAKEFYFRFKEGQIMIQQMKKSFYFNKSEWLIEYSQPFISLLTSSFLTDEQKSRYKKFFEDSKASWYDQLRSFLQAQIPQSENAFGLLNKGNLREDLLYPLMMSNNISLFHRDSQQNTQLYQCNNCKEYIFSNACPNLQSKTICLRCEKQIAKGNPNTKHVIQYADRSPHLLVQEIANNQWPGYYIRLEEDQQNFKLEQGNCIDLRIFSLLYNFSLLIAYENKNLYNSQDGITIFNQRTNTEENKKRKLINKILKINYSANPSQFLKEQINYALDHLTNLTKQLHNMNEQEKKITIYLCLENMLKSNQVQPVQQQQQRVQLNVALSHEISTIFKNSKNILLVSQQGSNLVPLILETENVNLANEYYLFSVNLRKTGFEITPKYIADFISNQETKEEFKILKELLDISKFQYISTSLKVLIQFTQLLQQQLSKSFTAKQAQEITLFQALQNDKYNILYRFYVEQVIPVWRQIKEREQEFSIGCQHILIQDLNENSKLNNLILTSDKQYGFFTNVLELLVNSQNNIIKKIISLKDLSKEIIDPHSSFSIIIEQLFDKEKNDSKSLKERTIEQIDPQFNILRPYNPDCLTKYVINSIHYSKGENLTFNLNYLQEELARQMLSGTTLISLENSQKFPFLVEINQINILAIEIPQEPIQELVSYEIQQYLRISPDGMDLLLKLTTLFSFFKSEKSYGNLSIKDALNLIKMQSPRGNIGSIFEHSLTLKHISKLIQLFEDQYMNKLVESCNPMYKGEIQKDQLAITLSYLQKNQIEILFFSALGRFIIRCLCQNQESISSNQKLFEQLFDSMTYEDFWNDPSRLDDLLPSAKKDETKIGQAYTLFKELQKNYQKRNYHYQVMPQFNESHEPNDESMIMDSFTDEKKALGRKRNKRNKK